MVKIINTSGKRKTAIARATLKAGKGVIRVNSVILESYGSEVTRMKISEPLLLVPNAVHGIDVTIDVAGGGVMGQAEAVRTALARGILKWHNEPSIKDIYLAYDRTLLVNDSRQKETKKPHGSGARAKFQKSYR
jgi:small subunit ribosomal protein S9